MNKNNSNNQINTDEEDFLALYEKSFEGIESYRPGQMVETTILSFSKDTIFLQLNGKSEGLLDLEELTDKNGGHTLKVGDTIKVFFLQAKDGELLFTTRIKGDQAGGAMIEQAFQNQIPVEGLVEKEVKGGYEVKIGDTRAFCPFSQMGQRRSENPSEFVGKHLSFMITEYKESGRNILVSNRVIHEEARKETLQDLKKTLLEGQVVKGVIQSIQDFGAFVDLGGVQALLPVSEIGRSRIEDIRKVLTVGQEIEGVLLKIDWKTEKLTLSMKSLLSDPWDQAARKYPEGSKHMGKVVRLTDFGAFVTLESGLDGLIHISELRGNTKFSNTEITLKLGQTLSVQIAGIDSANKRISLKPAPSAEEEALNSKYLDTSADNDTYNPFAALLKKK